LLCGLNPKLSQADVRALLCSGADDQVGDAADTAGFDIYYGAGRLNAYNSLLLAQTRIDQVIAGANNISISWPTPDNASTKKPYEIMRRSFEESFWTRVATSDAISFQNRRASWTSSTASPGIYEVIVR
jgi:hypothetical protein